LTRRLAVLRGGTLAAIAFAAFLPGLWAGFIADDFTLFHTVHHYNGIGWAFSRNDAGEAGEAGHFYRPLWVIWNAALFNLFRDSQVALHAASLALFAVIAIEVWLLARRLAGPEAGWAAGLAFALYPRHGESVAWISGNTDLTGVALALASLLCLLTRWPVWVRAVSSAVLAAAAALAKEVAFVLPALALLLLLLLRPLDDRATTRRLRVLAPLAMVIALAGVLAARVAVIGGVGGYSEYPWNPLRVLGVAGSYLLAAFSPPQLELTREPLFVLVPAALLALFAWRVWALYRRGERERLRVVLIGVLWFAIGLVPVLNLAVDLNNANGERLLFLSSVGLALAFAALVDWSRTWLLGATAFVAFGLCLSTADNWLVAGRIAHRMIVQALALAPKKTELILLTEPESYRTAHVYTGGSLNPAAEYYGRPDVFTSFCLPMEIRFQRSSQVMLSKRPDGNWDARTTWNAPFDFPVLRHPSPLGSECGYDRGSSSDWPLGLGLRGRAYPHETHPLPLEFAYFDGKNIRRPP
jgi:hypothetical protein